MIEDILQVTMVKALQKREEFQEAGHVMAWARVTSRNLALNHLQRHVARVVMLDDDVLAKLDADSAAESDGEQAQRLDALKRCVELLPERARAILEMRYFQGRDGGSLASHFQMSAAAIYKVIQRAHDALRECVAGKLREES